jgi:hypothetical protein
MGSQASGIMEKKNQELQEWAEGTRPGKRKPNIVITACFFW